MKTVGCEARVRELKSQASSSFDVSAILARTTPRDGNNLRGSDQLDYSAAPGQIPVEVIIRFHLHPLVSAARVKSRQILLKIHGQKNGWLFKCRGAETSLDRSVYLDGQRRSSCQQIILRCPASQIQTKGSLTINWAFSRHSSPR